jgi:hypothetical protein
MFLLLPLMAGQARLTMPRYYSSRQFHDPLYPRLANNAVSVEPNPDAGANRQHAGVNSRPMFSLVAVIGLFYGGKSRNNCEHGHRFMNRAANDKAERYGESPRKEMLIAVFAAARPVEFASIQLIRSDDDQVAPQHAQKTRNQFPAGDNTNNTVYSDEKTRHTQEHGDNGAGINEGITGCYGFVELGKFVDTCLTIRDSFIRSSRFAIHFPI